MRKSLGKYWNTFRKELPKRLLDVAFGAIGMLIALVANGFVDDRKERDTYRSMLAAIRSEASSNQTILTVSYGELFDAGGLILRNFDTSTASQLLSNPLFMKHAKSSDINLLSTYLRNMSLANGYRRVAEDLELHDPPKGREWKPNLKIAWGRNIEDIAKDLPKVLALGD